MFNYQPEEIKKLQIACNYLFKIYGGCENCNHQLCCRINAPVIHRGEVTSIARSLKMKPIDFEKKYLIDVGDKESNRGLNRLVMNRVPCPFLSNEKCEIHSSRPFVCGIFPFEVGLNIIQLHGIELCPTATLIAEEIREFLEQPDIHSDIIWDVRDDKGKNIIKQLEQGEKNVFPDDITKPIDDVYKGIGITEITQQEICDLYKTQEFLWFLEHKGLVGVNKTK
jgi:Fe-S-cluster containining protein